MATLQIADKPTLDAVKQDTTDILEAVSSGGGGGSFTVIDLIDGNQTEGPVVYAGSSLNYSRVSGILDYNGKQYICNNNGEIYQINEDFSTTYFRSASSSYEYGFFGFVILGSYAYLLCGANLAESTVVKRVALNNFKAGSWESATAMPSQHGSNPGICVYENEIHVIGGTGSTTGTSSSNTFKSHHAFNGSSWRSISLPFTPRTPILFSNGTYMYCVNTGSNTAPNYNVWRYDGTSWIDTGITMPYESIDNTQNNILVMDGKLYYVKKTRDSDFIITFDGEEFKTIKGASRLSSTSYIIGRDGHIYYLFYDVYKNEFDSSTYRYGVRMLTTIYSKSFFLVEGKKIIGNHLSILSDNLTRIDESTLLCTATGMATVSLDIASEGVNPDVDRYIAIV